MCPTPSCSSNEALSPSNFAVFFASERGVIGSAWRFLRLRDFNSRAGYTYAVRNEKDWILELLVFVWGKLLDRTDGPPIRCVAEEANVRVITTEILPVRTQDSRRSRLDLEVR